MIEVRHVQCGQIAYSLNCTIAELRGDNGVGVILNSAVLVYADGRELIDDDGSGQTGTIITCQACNRPAWPHFQGDTIVADSEWP